MTRAPNAAEGSPVTMSRRTSRLAILLSLLLVAGAAPTQAAEPLPAADPAAETAPVPASSSPEPTPSASPPGTPEPGDLPPASSEPTEASPHPGEASPDPTDASPEPSVAPDDPTPGEPARPDAPATPDSTPAPGEEERFIVVLEAGTSVAAAADRHERVHGAEVEREFRKVGAYVAELTAAEAASIARDPAVAAVVPDEPIELTAQTVPTGISRVSATHSTVASIDGSDKRVDADVAIVDTGIDATHGDLNVVGGVNCSTSDRSAWRDVHGHGTHVAGTVGALDNGYGVVGVAPGARLWAVKILDDSGSGYLSWYVCGLDWIAAQRDPGDASRPLFESVNMSVAKWGSDDTACGTKTNDILHAAICRVVKAGIPVVAAAANDSGSAAKRVPAAYNEVITVSALADTDGREGGLGGNACWSWGTYDKDDTFASFSNYGYDVDLIAPGKCILSTLPGNRYGNSSGTSMAAPHVAGAVALYKASRPAATPGEVRTALRYLGNLRWATSTDPDTTHEPLLSLTKLGALGDFSVGIGALSGPVTEAGGTFTLPVSISRSATFFEHVGLTVSAPAPLGASLSTASLYGWTASSSTLTLTVPRGTPAGTYQVTVSGTNWGRTRTGTLNVTVSNDVPVAHAPVVYASFATLGTTNLPITVRWGAATDASTPITAYELQASANDGPWGASRSYPAGTRSFSTRISPTASYRYRVRARDSVGNWSAWAVSAPYRYAVVQETSAWIRWTGTWTGYRSSYASGGAARYSTRAGSSAQYTTSGRGIAVVMPKGPTRGSARIWVDGVLVKTVSLYRSTTASRQIVFSRSWASPGTHTIVVQVVGTSGRPRIDLDAFVVLR